VAGFLRQEKKYTEIVVLDGAFEIRDGLAMTENLALTLRDGEAKVSGLLGLADQTLNLRLRSRIAKRGLTIPARVTGTFAAPKFAVEAAPLGVQVWQQEEVKAKARGLLDSIFKNKLKKR
jgi:hypothetical protein